MRRLFLSLLLVVAAFSAASILGCGASSSNAKLLEAHTWRVTKIGDAAYNGSAAITSRFSAGKVSGSTGVNQYAGTYQAASGNNIAVTLGPMTLMAGTPDAMKAEADFVKALGSATSYAADDESLTLFDAGGQSALVYAVQ
jgi:heat shock protein HslJ